MGVANAICHTAPRLSVVDPVPRPHGTQPSGQRSVGKPFQLLRARLRELIPALEVAGGQAIKLEAPYGFRAAIIRFGLGLK